MNETGQEPGSTPSRRELVRMLGIGFLPILVYIIIESLVSHLYGEETGIKVGLAVALLFGIGSFVVSWVREHRLDGFVLLDTALLLLMGGISLAFSNPIFFKLKPALIEVIVLILVAATAFSRSNLLIAMTGRYMKDVSFDDEQINAMRGMMRTLFYLLSAHVVLIVYAAFKMSQSAWAFISGPLFYIVILLLPAYSFIQNRLRRDDEANPIVDVVNEMGETTGRAGLAKCRTKPSRRCALLVMLIFDDRGWLFLQRPKAQPTNPNQRWQTPLTVIPLTGVSHEESITIAVKENFGLDRLPHELIGLANSDAVPFVHLRIYRGYGSRDMQRIKADSVLEAGYFSPDELKAFSDQDEIDLYTRAALGIRQKLAGMK